MKLQKKRDNKTRLIGIWQVLLLLISSIYAYGQENAVDLYRKGTHAQLDGSYHRAVELYKESLSLNSFFVKPMIGLAESFHVLGQNDEALNWAVEARKLDGQNIMLINLEAKIRTGLGELPEARELYQGVLESEPNNLEAMLGLAQLDLADGKKRQAALQLLETLRASPGNLQALLHLALLYEELGDEEASLTYLEQALKYSNDNPEVYYTAGRYFYRKGEYEGAVEYLNTALSLKPNYHQAKQLLADIFILQDRAVEAVPLLKEIITSQIPDQLYQARYTLGIAYADTGAVGEALTSFSWALRIKPGEETARIAAENLAMRYPEQTKRQRRLYAFYRLEEGRKYERNNQLTRAQLEYRRSLALDNEYHDARLAYANVFRIMGFPYKYLMELLFLRDYFQYEETDFLDTIEIYENKLINTVGVRWASRLIPFRDPEKTFDQYSLERDCYSIAIFTLGPDNSLVHLHADREFIHYIEHLLFRYDIFDLPCSEREMDSFNQAYREARVLESDYFFIVRFEENERSIQVDASVYLTRTGSPVASLSVYRTGNKRVEEALLRLSTKLKELFSLKGRILAREFDRGVVDVGTFQGVEVEDRFLIIKKNRLHLRSDKVGFVYKEEDVLGNIEIIETDENLSEGIITPGSFFDRINPGDQIILLQEE
jgi:tetratricopeptide (TPR) repeat protein